MVLMPFMNIIMFERLGSYFPHNIGLGYTFDSEIVYKVADITAREVTATRNRLEFAPCLAIPQMKDGRYYEGYSEDSKLVSDLGVATIKGYQKYCLVKIIL